MASNNIKDFAGKFLKGGIRPHLFEVHGSFPTGGQDDKAPFLIKAAQMPASTLGLIEVPFRGRKIKVPGDRTFAEWTITVLMDGDLQMRDKFELWSQFINAHEGNFPTNETAPLETPLYQDWQVHQLDRQGSPIKTYNFVGVWPSEIAAVDLNHETTDSLSEFTVTLQYSYWTSNTTDGDGTILGAISGLFAGEGAE
tara:strand:- start:96 stop:686 length:591 start_codon:yes stop_codon:yes gene_type:complete